MAYYFDHLADLCPRLEKNINHIPVLQGALGVALTDRLIVPAGRREIYMSRLGDVVELPVFDSNIKVELEYAGHLFVANPNKLLFPLVSCPFYEFKVVLKNTGSSDIEVIFTHYQLYKSRDLAHAHTIVTNNIVLVRPSTCTMEPYKIYDINEPSQISYELRPTGS